MPSPDAITVTATGSTITTGAASVRVAIPVESSGGIPKYCRLTATQPCFVKPGTVAVTAVAGDLMIQPADSAIIRTFGMTHIAAIQNTAPGLLQISPLEDS